MTGIPILIVDDNPLNLQLISYLLTFKGYEVHTTINAEETLNTLKLLEPQLILMDIQLPGMDGLTLTQQLKSNPKFKHVPIIAISAYAMKGDKEKALEAGCDDYITKPIDVKTLPDIIAKHLQDKKQS